MKFVTSQTKIEKIKTDALVVLTSKTLNKSIKHIDKNLNGVITKMIQDGDFTGKNISTCVVCFYTCRTFYMCKTFLHSKKKSHV